MEFAVFDIEFPEHVPEDRQHYWCDQLRTHGARVERCTGNRWRVACENPSVHHEIGWVLFHTAIAGYARVTATAGEAEARASAYPMPDPKQKRLGHRTKTVR
jgi:hypothetical protein